MPLPSCVLAGCSAVSVYTLRDWVALMISSCVRCARCSLTPRRSVSGGFSLIEVLVAFVIMAGALAVLYQSVGTSVSTSIRLENQSRAVVLARSMLALHPWAPVGGLSDSGSSPDGLVWQVSSMPFTEGVSEASRRLHRLTVTVSWNEGRSTRSLVLETLVPETGA